MNTTQSIAVEMRLRAAADVVRRGWCQRDCARDGNGWSAMSSSPQAVVWCAVGALIKSGEEVKGGYRTAGMVVSAYLTTPAGPLHVVRFNDRYARDAEHVATMMERVADIIRAVRKGTPVPEKAPEVLPQTWVVTKQEPAELVTA